MESHKKEFVEVTLVLNGKEAEWLKGLMQNPIGDVSPEYEREDDRKMRKMFREALS